MVHGWGCGVTVDDAAPSELGHPVAGPAWTSNIGTLHRYWTLAPDVLLHQDRTVPLAGLRRSAQAHRWLLKRDHNSIGAIHRASAGVTMRRLQDACEENQPQTGCPHAQRWATGSRDLDIIVVEKSCLQVGERGSARVLPTDSTAPHTTSHDRGCRA